MGLDKMSVSNNFINTTFSRSSKTRGCCHIVMFNSLVLLFIRHVSAYVGPSSGISLYEVRQVESDGVTIATQPSRLYKELL
jgi:hypothetical protein